MFKTGFWRFIGLPFLFGAAACQSTPDAQPARISGGDMDALKQVLSQVTGRAEITHLPANPLGAGTLSVPPPRLSTHETRSPAVPRTFTVMTDGDTCYLLDAATGKKYDIPGLKCEASN